MNLFKIVYVCITKSHDSMGYIKGRENVYECTRKYWKLDPLKANRADYVAGVSHGVIKGIFKNTSGWKSCRSFLEFYDDAEVHEHPEYMTERFAFEGVEAEEDIQQLFLNTRIPGYLSFHGNVISYGY